MKQCPVCKGLELYDDAETRCPHCDAILVPYVRANRRSASSNRGVQEEPVQPAQHNTGRQEAQPEFEQIFGGRIQYRGIVDSITPSSRFMSRSLKWANAVFRGQPYQFGNPVHETIIRIEEISQSRLPDRMRSLVYYGELGELDVGDDVTISAVRGNDRLVIKDIVINDIETSVRPHGQMSAAAVRVLTLLLLVFIYYLFSSIISAFTSGRIFSSLGALARGIFVTFAPILGLLFVFSLFFRRRR